MTYTYVVDHEVITRGTTTIESDKALTTDELKTMMGTDGSSLPGSFVQSDETPVMYGDVLSISGDLAYEA